MGDIILEDREVSAVHAMVVYERGAWRVLDLGSTNGVFVDEQLQMECSLRHGAMVRFGTTTFTFRCDVVPTKLGEPSPTLNVCNAVPGETVASLRSLSPCAGPTAKIKTPNHEPVPVAPAEVPPERPFGTVRPCEMVVVLEEVGGEQHRFQ
ncbi:MAG: FHA domain-containing protein [Proteobacteria bacterium]|nr:FHA domain-containing protein [Pseudomonadota bacterium]